jgi:glycosyltransferase involved in cell wall biosynthesis
LPKQATAKPLYKIYILGASKMSASVNSSKSMLNHDHPVVRKTTISVVIPVYNSEGSLPALVQRLEPVLTTLASEFELILVNDGSRDKSWNVIKRLASGYPWLRGINLVRNYGQHNATLCGIRAAQYEVIVTLDDDLQNPPEEIPLLLSKLEEGYDVVYGVPQLATQNVWRTLASHVIRLVLNNLMGGDIAWQVRPFRAFRTSIRNAFANYDSPSVFIDVLLSWGATLFTAVSVRQDARKIGASTYTFGKLINLALNMLTDFSTLPLRAASMVGFFFTLFGMSVLAYVIGRYIINGGSIPGFPFLASIITIFSGAILFALGIIGEYLARTYIHLMGQPQYMIREEAVNG